MRRLVQKIDDKQVEGARTINPLMKLLEAPFMKKNKKLKAQY